MVEFGPEPRTEPRTAEPNLGFWSKFSDSLNRTSSSSSSSRPWKQTWTWTEPSEPEPNLGSLMDWKIDVYGPEPTRSKPRKASLLQVCFSTAHPTSYLIARTTARAFTIQMRTPRHVSATFSRFRYLLLSQNRVLKSWVIGNIVHKYRQT